MIVVNKTIPGSFEILCDGRQETLTDPYIVLKRVADYLNYSLKSEDDPDTESKLDKIDRLREVLKEILK